MWSHTRFQPSHNYLEAGLVQITSEYEFYDLFLVVKEKLALKIKDTILMKKGAIHCWLFTSKAAKGGQILKKRPINTSLCKYISKNLPVPPELEYDSFFQLLGFLEQNEDNKNLLRFHIRTNGDETLLVTPFKLLNELNMNNTEFKMVQQLIVSDRNDKMTLMRDKYYTHVYHYVHTSSENPRGRVFTKQLLHSNKFKSNKKGLLADIKSRRRNYKSKPDTVPTPFKNQFKDRMNALIEDNLDSEEESEDNESVLKQKGNYDLVFTSGSNFKISYYPNFNTVGNSRIEKMSERIIEFIERNLLLKIREVSIKFCFDRSGMPYFVGFKKLLGVIRHDSASPRIIRSSFSEYVDDDQINTININKYMKALHAIDEDDDEALKIMRKVKPPKRKLKTKRKQICKGFFCDYLISDKVENCFKVKKEIEFDMREAEKGGVKLLEHRKDKYCVTSALLEKIENNLKIIDEVLNVFNIVNPSNKNLVDQEKITPDVKQRSLKLIQKLEQILFF